MGVHYSFSEFIKNSWSLVCTKLFYRGARLVRRPIYIRGGKGLSFGSGFTTGYRCRIELFGDGRIVLGKNCKIGDNVHIVASDRVEIGDDCLMASHIFISDTHHGSGDDHPLTPPDKRPLSSNSVSIGKCVWIGEGVCILPGAKIGDGCILGAHSVVKGEIPDFSMVAGAPARIIKRFNTETGKWERN